MTRLGRTVLTEPLEARIPRKRSVKASTALAALVALGLGLVAVPSANAQSLTTLYSFCSQSGCTDGQAPFAGLVQGMDGDFYGTTAFGGSGAYCNDQRGCGTVFRITSTGALTTLYSFCSQSGCTDGAYPNAGLVQGSDGNFYGTTYVGGTAFAYGGTIFKVTPGGSLTTVYSFCSQSGCSDGQGPYAGLVQGSDGSFYGTTDSGEDPTKMAQYSRSRRPAH